MVLALENCDYLVKKLAQQLNQRETGPESANNNYCLFFIFQNTVYSSAVTSLLTSPFKSCISAKPMPQERELPEKWVDTRIFPAMTKEEVMYARKDQDLFYKRRYFIYTKDRMRSLSYNLELDGIFVKNTEEHQRMKRRLLEAKEEEVSLKWKEMTMKEEEENKLKDKVELEKRWCEMNKGNVELWKLEQKKNEKKWREKWIREERRRRDLEAQWEKVEVQFKASNEEEEIADKEKVRMGHASIPGLI